LAEKGGEMGIAPIAVEAMKTAIQMEEEGRVFYEKAAQETGNNLGKKMFERLARDEIEHKDTFQKIFDAITSTEDWTGIAQQYSPKIGKLPIFEGEIEKKGSPEPSELDALRTGMENEKKSVDYYEKVAGETDDPLAKELLTKIRDEEAYHYDLLQAQHDYLSRSGVWLDVAEFQMNGRY
jgi:rubrerythrin